MDLGVEFLEDAFGCLPYPQPCFRLWNAVCYAMSTFRAKFVHLGGLLFPPACLQCGWTCQPAVSGLQSQYVYLDLLTGDGFERVSLIQAIIQPVHLAHTSLPMWLHPLQMVFHKHSMSSSAIPTCSTLYICFCLS